MSRSYRHSPYLPITGRRSSEKLDKKIWHSRRRAQEQAQDATLDEDGRHPVSKHVAGNKWCMKKDDTYIYIGTREEVGKGVSYATMRQYYHAYGK